jgi:hypothetical protein
MPDVLRNNLVTLTLLGEDGAPLQQAHRIPLTLASPWTLACGLRPNVNHATVAYYIYDQISGFIDSPARIEFWYEHGPGEKPEGGSAEFGPDLTLEPVYITGVQPGALKVPIDSQFVQPEDYDLFLSDFRIRFADPRGGRLTQGLLNKGPVEDPENDYSFADLVQACLDAMGIDTPLPDGLDDIAAPRDVKWLGNHAPTELQKLLDQCGCVFVPYLNQDSGFIDRIRGDGEPDIPPSPEDRLPDILLPELDIRGKVVIFTSYPTPVLITETKGYGQDQEGEGDFGGAENVNVWEYVAQDGDGQWKSLEDDGFKLMHDAGGYTKAAQNHFKDVPDESAPAINAQFARFIRLKEDFAPHGSSQVQNLLVEEDGPIEIAFTADDMAIMRADGVFANLGSSVDVPVKHVAEGNILELASPCFTVKSPSLRPHVDFFKALAKFTIRYTRGGVQADEEGNSKPWYYQVGFQIGANGVEQMDDDTVAAIIAGQSKVDARIFSRPQYQLLQVDDEIVNQDDLDNKAEAEAGRYFAGIQFPARIARLRGFSYVGLSGLVSEVQWDQHQVLTTARLNDWYTADGAIRLSDLYEGGGESHKGKSAGDAFPNQRAAETNRAKLGGLGSPGGIGTRPLNPTEFSGQGKAGIYIQLSDYDADGFFAWEQAQPSDGATPFVLVDADVRLTGETDDSPAIFNQDFGKIDPDEAKVIMDALLDKYGIDSGQALFAVPEQMLANDPGPDDPDANPCWVIIWPGGNSGKQIRFNDVVWDGVAKTLSQNRTYVYFLGGVQVKVLPADPITIDTAAPCIPPP